MLDSILFGAFFAVGFLVASGILISIATFIKWPFDLKKELESYKSDLKDCYETCSKLRKKRKGEEDAS